MSAELTDLIGRILHFIGWTFLPLLLLPILVLWTGKLSNLSEAIIKTTESFMLFIGELTKWVMPFMVISVGIAVFALSIYGVSSIWWDESAIYLHAIGICIGVAPTYLAGQHVKVDIFFEKMSNRKRALVELCGFYALLIPVCLAVIWRSQSFVSFAWQSFEGSTNTSGIKGIYLLKTALSVMFIMLLIQGLSMALRAALALRDEKPLPVSDNVRVAFSEDPVDATKAL